MKKYLDQGKHFDRYFGQVEDMLAVDRVVINTLEQMVLVLMALWLFAIFISSTFATWYGGAYIFLRPLYPFLSV